MSKSKFARQILVALLVAGLTLPTFAQSGRKRQIPPASPPASGQSNPQSNPGGQTEQTRPRNAENKSSDDKPLADNTPTTVSEDGTIKLETSLVTIPVSVSDRDGRFVPNLVKRDFKVYEDGVEQEIESIVSVDAPFHVVLLIDTSNSTQFKMEEIHQAAVAFVNELNRDDQVAVVSFDSNIERHCDFTGDRRVLRDAIYQTRNGGSTKLYEGVDFSLHEMLGRIQGRKAIVLFTDGVDTSSRKASARSTLEDVEEADTLVFPLRYNTEFDNQGGVYGSPGRTPPIINIPWPAPRNPGNGGRYPRWPFINYQFPGQWPQGGGRMPMPGGRGDYTKAAQYLQDLADRSGGRLYFADSVYNLSGAFSQIAEELRHQYSLSYYPSNAARDGSYRQLKVRVYRPNLVVRSRQGYRATPETQAKDDKRKEFKPKQVAGAK